jgi:type IV/VI secretion system ImpK/VasF family protein
VATLLHYFTDLFSYGLALDERLQNSAGYAKGSDEIYPDLRRRVEQAKLSALAGNKKPADVDEASFAVVAWLDEMIAQHPEHWNAATMLQVTLFSTHDAGDLFFPRLQALSADQDEVREIYYVALCLGFRGMYYFEVADTGELGKLKELHIRHLPLQPARISALADEKVTAQPYGVPDLPGPVYPGNWPEKIAKAGMLVAVAAIVGIVAYHLWKPVAPVGPDAELIAQHLANYECHDFILQKHESGRVQVGGHVRSASEKEKLAKELRRLPGGERITLNVDTLAEPFCEVVGLVAANRQLNTTSNYGLKVSTRGAGERLIEGQTITLDATLPGRPGCLYVDYFVADGKSVVHLFPSADDASACGLRGGTIPIGEPKPGKAPWQVSPPFGREMVLAIASPTPLYAGQRSGIEAPQDYLPALRQALEVRNDTVVADYLLVITEKK